MLSGAVLLTFALWLVGTVAMSGLVVRRVAQAAAIAVALGTAWLVLPLGSQPSESAVRASGSAEAYSDGRLAEYRAAGRPVFVNATAAWCVTCIVNERVALSSDVVKDAFAKANIAYLKADWTNQDPTITAFLERFGRAGVPLYVFYPPGQIEPVVLPQILTPSIVVDAITPVTAASAS
ncbi:Thiol:disulfide interchange protein DsbD,putative (fragment) [Mesorhizobium metallidurans STM 2683]|uniref:Thiol:disulfide interchange protein DsbD,putative n=1 Tax=Mesorhizobium metallidurans STM 2683 TaxID=1297569 RepID=M5ETT9_9HYPH